MNLAPIVLFVYNRPWHTQKTIDALRNNFFADTSQLYIYSDAPANLAAQESVNQVRKIIKNADGFKEITILERKKNLGLANSIIDGVTNIINQYGKVIVLEDDLVTSRYFLQFMNKGLDFYHNDDRILSLTGFSFSEKYMQFSKNYPHDIYLHIRPMSWSWATWLPHWSKVDWYITDFEEFISNPKKIMTFNKGGDDLTEMLISQMAGKIDSWYVRWAYHAYCNNKLTVYPRVSFVNNIGFDNSGVHCGTDKNKVHSHTELRNDENYILTNDIAIEKEIIKKFNSYFNRTLVQKITKMAKGYFRKIKRDI